MEYYPLMAMYLVKAAGVGILLNSAVLLISLISVRPQNRHKGYSLLALSQGVFEFVLGLWALIGKPLFNYNSVSFLAGMAALITIYSLFFVRLYFINVLRAMSSK